MEVNFGIECGKYRRPGRLPTPRRRDIQFSACVADYCLVHLLSWTVHLLSFACFWQFLTAADFASSTDFRTAPPHAGPLSGLASAAHFPGGAPKRTLQASDPQSRRAASFARSWVASSHANPFSIADRVKLRPGYLMRHTSVLFYASANDATRGSCFSSRSARAAS